MKRLIYFGIFILVLIILFLFYANRVKDYETEYTKDNFNISERFDKEEGNYYFSLKKDNNEFSYVINHKYSTRRKIIDKIEEREEDGYSCVNIKVFGYQAPYVCEKDNEYVDGYTVGLSEEKQTDEIKRIDKISVFNDDYEYYIWNGHGITGVLDNKEYNFLNKESYDNNLSYQLGAYLIVADYDATREFSKFYVFNQKTKKISEWEFDAKISFNSYFMGDKDDLIYLFDKKNKIQYKINILKETLTISSDAEGALYYDNKWDTIGLNKLVYNNIYFNEEELINYFVNDEKMYFYYKASDKKILFEEGVSIVSRLGNDIFYLKKDCLYKYNVDEGRSKLLSYFEWNFSATNKIFIFN